MSNLGQISRFPGRCSDWMSPSSYLRCYNYNRLIYNIDIPIILLVLNTKILISKSSKRELKLRWHVQDYG
jgi:hypothetical protein